MSHLFAHTGPLPEPFEECEVSEQRFRLRGLEAEATYEIQDVDMDPGAQKRLKGSELMREGLPVALPDRPRAAILTYRRAGD